ncbi:MAG: hypothetical protein WCQ67_00805 [Treponema sp.]
MKKNIAEKKIIIICIFILTVLLLDSCASTKKAEKTTTQETEEEGAPAGSLPSTADDDAIEQNAVLSTDGTIAENVPRVGGESTNDSAKDTVNSEKNVASAEDESNTESNDSLKKAAAKKKETPEEKKVRLAAEKAQKEALKKANQEAKQKEKEAKEKAKALAKIEKQKRKDNYTGWVYIPKKNFNMTNGDIKLDMRGSTGSFELYAIPEVGSPVPLLATYDDFCSTFFSLLIGRKEYRLNREAGVKSEARKTEYGTQMAYTIPNKAQVVVDFSFMPSIATSSRIDMLRVTVYTINLGKSTQSFSVKGVFDTSLGENTMAHFSTAAHSRINKETQYSDMSVEKWIRSSNEKAAIQFIFDGYGVTKPRSIILGNRDFLSTSVWLPVVQETRSFSSVLAYNNSAMSVNWKTSYLDPMKTDVITFYISVASDGNEPAGKEFIATLNSGKSALPSNLPNSVQLTTVAPEPVPVPSEPTTYYENMPAISGDSTVPSTAADVNKGAVLDTEKEETVTVPAIPIAPAVSVVPSTSLPTTTSSNPAVTNNNVMPKVDSSLVNKANQTYNGSYPLSSITKAQLDPEYIQTLLDRISDLESDPALVDKAEVKRLNDELDAILSIIRSQE